MCAAPSLTQTSVTLTLTCRTTTGQDHLLAAHLQERARRDDLLVDGSTPSRPRASRWTRPLGGAGVTGINNSDNGTFTLNLASPTHSGGVTFRHARNGGVMC